MNESGNGPSISAKTVPWGPRVYFIDDGELIKIGFSEATHMRFGGLQSNHGRVLKLLGTVPAEGHKTERELHERFAHLRERGEWFRRGPELMRFISENCEMPRRPKLTWSEQADQFAKGLRRLKLDSRAIHAGVLVGSTMRRLATNETPELKAELAKAIMAFELARAST